MTKWISIKKRRPPLERIVLVCYRSGYDGGPMYAFGARVDGGEGWLWAIQQGHNGGIRLGKDANWNGVEADDDYQVTHWQSLPPAPFRHPAKSPTGTLRLHANQ